MRNSGTLKFRLSKHHAKVIHVHLLYRTKMKGWIIVLCRNSSSQPCPLKNAEKTIFTAFS